MKPIRRWLLNALVVLLPASAFSILPATNQPLPNFDNRTIPAIEQSAVSTDQAAAVSELRAALPKVQVDFSTVGQAPKMILDREGFLSGANGNGRGISTPNLLAIPNNDPNRVTKAFLREHQALFGHGPENLDAARVRRDFVTPNNGMRTVVWEQQADGIPVFEAVLISHVTQNGELVNIGSQFIPDPDKAASQGVTNRALLVSTPNVTAQEAVAISARNAGEGASIDQITPSGASDATPEKNARFTAPFLKGEADAKLIWLPMDRDTLRLCWDVTLMSRTRGEMYRVLVDAETGLVQIRRCLTDYLQDASYRVYTSDSPTPMSPGFPTPVSTQPPMVSRTLVTTPGLDLNASPNGWINDGGNETLGNNVDAHTDLNNDDLADLPRPQGSPFRVFDFPMDLTTQNPTSYSQAAVVQLFYWNNFMHDKLYELGFTEAAGNFQSNNFGRGGLGNDAVQADAQDGGGFNNANFSTPADGSPGRMQMYVFNGPTPQRDGDLDAEVVLHEYTHGLSNRRVGGGVGISALQPSGMGEGWSDFYALSMLSDPGDDPNAVYAAGAYATYQLSGMTQNYYFGIRRYPYCTDMSKNPLTFKDIDPAQASAHTGVPRSSIVGTTANEVHNMGEVWCVTLWDARANLINAYGGAVGNQLMLQLVTDGMNLSPGNPTFLQARDAIIQADQVDNGGANRNLLWAAFAKRGMGISATSPASSTTVGLVEAYDIPDDLQINPSVLSSSGPVGGPFTPNPAFFTVTNSGSNSLSWNLTSSATWITVSPTNGTLAAGAGTSVSVTISSIATNFPLGTTNAIIWFTNQTSGVGQARTFSLSAVGRSLFENFEPGIHQSLWSSFGGVVGSTVIATNYGGSVSGANSLWFGDAGTRSATTIAVDTSAGGSINFYLHLGNGPAAPWENVDLPDEGIVLEYSINNGATWTIMGTYNTTTFYNWTQVTTNIPPGAMSSATQFRWRQLTHSGTCCDHWALDDISIDAGPTPPFFTSQPASQTVKSGNSVAFSVSVQGSSPLFYLWLKDGTNLSNGGRISGADTATLSISNTLESDSGQYSVLVTNIYGPATSSNAVLIVTPLDHFEWAAISSPQAVGFPFNATITAKDFLNATVTNYNGSVGLSATGGGPGEVYRADFESGLQGYTINNSFGLGNGLWHRSSGRGAQAGHSPTNSVYFGTGEGPNGGGTYNTGTAVEGVMDSPLIDLSSVAAPLKLSFNCMIQSEGGTSWDHGTLEVSTNNGATYTILVGNNQGPNVFGTDSLGLWIGVTNDFSAYAGSQVRLRLHFNTIDAGANAFEGWYVDDIVISGTSTPVTVSPASSRNFTNGIWSGLVNVQSPATNVVLRADDNSGHIGLSNPFTVLLQNDISLTLTDSPDPVSIGGNLTYTITVANAGPATATGVRVTNTLPAGVNFVSANSSQGSTTLNGGVVFADLGTVPGGANATVTIVVMPVTGGTLTNTAVVSRAEADPLPGNNSASVSTLVKTPAVSINDVSILEGNFGTTNAIFTVTLDTPAALLVSIDFATADSTANSGMDYIATNGTLIFAPGEISKQIPVAVKGDTISEPNEIFFVNLSNPTNASLTDPQGMGTILSDDVPSAVYLRSTAGAPWGSTSNEFAMSRVFGSNNWQDLRFETVNSNQLFSPATTFIFMEGSDVDALELQAFLTANISAIQNWVSNGGSLFLNAAPNEGTGMSFGFGVTLTYPDTTATGGAALLTHPIFNGPFTPVGTSWSGNSFAHATVSGNSLTTLITNSATGNIVLAEMAYGAGHVLFGGMTTDNFHTPQPQAGNLRANIIAYLGSLSGFHFEWSGIPSPQFLNATFPVTIIARDSNGGVFTNFNGPVAFNATGGNFTNVPATPPASDNFTNGVWSGTVAIPFPATGVVLTARDGSGHSGASNPFDVVTTNDLALTMADSPDPVSVGANLTYTLTITNSGPDAATGVTVTNILPVGATFISATASQGTAVQNNGLVVGNLGTIAGAANASISIVVVPTNSNLTLTNTATVFRNEPDGYASNNTASVVTTVTPPGISVGDASVVEGNVGSRIMVFPVTLTTPSAQTIQVNFATSDGTAFSGSDYAFTNGVLVFQPGTTNLEVDVTVFGDIQIEPNENFFVNLSNPVNGLITRAQGTGTITNDDGLPGQLYSFAWYTIGSPQTQNQPIAATIIAEDAANAVVGSYNGTVLISGSIGTGATNTILNSPAPADTSFGEFTLGYSFTLNTNVTVTHVRHYFGDKVSIWTDTGTLIASQNVTSAPGVWTETRLDTPVQLANGVTYRIAVHSTGTDYGRGDLGTNFPNGTLLHSYQAFGDSFPNLEDGIRWWLVDLRYTVGFSPIVPLVSGNFTNGIWSGNVTVQAFATNLVLRADDGYGHTGSSNPFNVVGTNQPPVVILGPTNTAGYLGGVASFQVNALGTGTLFYQWRFNGAAIPGATNSTLAISRVLPGLAGGYSVLVSNAFGSTSSSKATLSIVQVAAWGAGTNSIISSPNFMQSIVPPGLTNISRLAGGIYHSLAAGADGKVYAWGAGTNNTQLSPNYGQSIVPPIGNVIAVAGGGYHTLALRDDGSMAAWGAGTNSIFGAAPNYGQSTVPAAASNVIAVAAGDYHSVALRADGKVLVWGNNGFSQTNVPFTATNLTAVASRGNHVLAMRADGVLIHWGSQIGVPPQTTNYVAIAAGVNHALALRNDGIVVTLSGAAVPFGLSNVVDIAAGLDHSLALKSDGTVVTWGTLTFGRDQIPVGLSNVVGIACGSYNSLAYLGDGSPVIKYQPTIRPAFLNTPVSFSVLAVGQQLRYQWQRNGTNIQGATNFLFNLPFVQAANAGSYRAIITNAYGAVTSSVANLTVLTPLATALDNTSVQWSTSGNAAWFGETTISHDNVDAAQSGLITDNQQSTLQTTVTGPGVLNFWWKVSSEQYFDTLGFFIDGVQQTNISGEVNWQFQSLPIGAGSHQVKWTYQKDSSASTGLDSAWLDQVVFTPDPPVFTLQPVGQTNSMGATIQLSVSASGAPPITYQWLKSGTNLTGANSSLLVLSNATRHDSAVYSALATNPGGTTPSSNATVSIQVPQQLRLLRQPDGTFVLTSGDADGGPLLPADITNLEPQASSNLFDWVPLTNSLVLTNGTLLLTDPDGTNHPSRYYRIIEH